MAVFHRGDTEADLRYSIRHIYGDRNALPAFKEELGRFGPDVVIDMVPYTEEQARQVVRVFNGFAERLVIVSSSDVYRNYDGWRGASDHVPDPVPLTENAPIREKLYPYRKYEGLDFEHAAEYEKILVERAAKSGSGPRATILRLPAVYGEGDKQHRFFKYLKRMIDEHPVILVQEEEANWRWTHGYVHNIAAAIALAATDRRAAGRTYNVGEQETPTTKERIERLGEVAGWTGNVVALPKEQLPEHLRTDFGWQYDLAIDTSRIRKEPGYAEPVPEAEVLARTVAWERQHAEAQELAGHVNYEAEDEAIKDAA